MNVGIVLLLLLLCSLSSSREYGLFFHDEESYLQTSYFTMCDESTIKFEILINKTSGVVMYAENKVKSVKLIAYFERPGMYINVTDGPTKYTLPLTLDFFSNQWFGWHDVEIKLSEYRIQLTFDSTGRQIELASRQLFPEDVVEENEIYFGASPSWTQVGNVTRFSGYMRNLKYRSCGCNEWRPVKVLRIFAVSMEYLGDCMTAKDACERDCVCYLFQWGGKRCECPRERCAQTSDNVSYNFDRGDSTSNRLKVLTGVQRSVPLNGPYGRAMNIDANNYLQLYVPKGRTCFKNVFLCENGFQYSFWIWPTVLSTTNTSTLMFKHSSSLASTYGLTVTRMLDNIVVSLVNRDGRISSIRSPMTLSVWSLVTIIYNQSHLSLYIDSYFKDSSDRFITIKEDLSDLLSLSTRFLFIGNNEDHPHVSISDWQFSSDISSHSLTSIKELRLEQYIGLRKTNINCRLYVEDSLLNLKDCFKRVFGVEKFPVFHVSLIFNASNDHKTILVESTFLNLIVQPLNNLIIEMDGLQHREVKLLETVNKLYYIEISVTERGELTVFQGMDVELLRVNIDRIGPFNSGIVRVNSDFNWVRKFRIMNSDSMAGDRSRRIIKENFTQLSEDFSETNPDIILPSNLVTGYVGKGLQLKHNIKPIVLTKFKKSCSRYLASCYHGLTVSFWIKLPSKFEDSNGKPHQILSSGKNGISLLIDLDGLYFILVMEARITTRFILSTDIAPVNQWHLIEVTISQNGIPFLFINRQEAERSESSKSVFTTPCSDLCIGDETSKDNKNIIIIDEIRIWDVEREFLYANEFVSPGPSVHKLISFTNYQLNETFTMKGSANIISIKNGYALGLNNFGARYASINLANSSQCLWNLDRCRRGVLFRIWLRPDNLALSHQTILKSPFVSVSLNLEYLSIQVKASSKIWSMDSKDLLQLFVWHMIEISWHRSTGLKTYINGRLTGLDKDGRDYNVVPTRITPSLLIGIDYSAVGNINFATVLIDDLEIFEADQSNLAYENHSVNDLTCSVLFNFDNELKRALSPALGIVGSAGYFQPDKAGTVTFPMPTCFNDPTTRCLICFTLRMWLNVRKSNISVLESSFLRLFVAVNEIRIEIGAKLLGNFLGFICRYDGSILVNKWNFIEISWDTDEGVLLFLNREGIVCDLKMGTKLMELVVFDKIEISEEFVGLIDEIELYHARLSVLYWNKVLDESQALLIIDKIKEKERIEKEVLLLKKALNSATVNRSVEIVDSFQFNGSNYVSYKLPKNTYTYIPGGREELEISFKCFDTQQSSIIWISDSLLSKNTLTLKNKRLYFTKVHVLTSANTSMPLTEELKIHDNILPNVVYNVVIYQRAGEIVMKTTSVNDSHIQSTIGRTPLIPLDSNVYFGGYNNLKLLKLNQVNSSLSGIIYKARLKASSSEKPIDIIQEMADVKHNPNIGNHGNVVVLKKILKPDQPQKTSFLATLSYAKVPLTINSPFFSVKLPRWDFNLLTSVEIEFSTMESRGLLLFIGNISHFLSLEIFDSELFFVWKYNGVVKRMRTHSDLISVSDNKPHRVYLGRDLSGNIQVYFNRDEIIDNATRLEDIANSVSVIGHLGAYDNWPPEVLSRVSFVGCIHFVRINDADYVDFARKSTLIMYDEVNMYEDISARRTTPFKSGVCELSSVGACDNFPCNGGWCQLTTVSASGQLTNNFRCNCLLASKSLASDFTGDSELNNYNMWMYQYLLQGRSRPCTEDTKSLVIVDRSFFEVTFRKMFPFVSVLDLEFLVMVKSPNSCIIEMSFDQRNLSIAITNGRLVIHIARTTILSFADVNLYDNEWHGVQIQVRLNSIRIKVGNIQKDVSYAIIAALNVSSITIGQCADHTKSHFKIKHLSYNNLNLIQPTSPRDHKLFYSATYHYPLVSDIDDLGRNYYGPNPITFLNHFQTATLKQTFNITWYTQMQLSLSSLYPGSIVHIINRRHILSLLLCRDYSLLVLHGDNLKKPKMERVALNSDRIKFTITIDLIRSLVKLKRFNSNVDQILDLGIDLWNIGDLISLQFGVLGSTSGMPGLSDFDSENRQCLNDGIGSAAIGCLDRFLWSDGTTLVSYTDRWSDVMSTKPPESLIFGQCIVVEKCARETCANGQCQSSNHYNTYCNCSGTEFVGKRCHLAMDKCSKHVCLNNGKCASMTDYNGIDTVYCNCAGTGFTGRICEKILCTNDFCTNNGQCYTSSNTLHCDCNRTTYSGPRCEQSVCKPSTCNGHGSCQIISKTTAPICDCDKGFFGDFCEENSSGQCDQDCKNEGVCARYQPPFKLCSNRYCRQLSAYKCNCDNTFYRGRYCEEAEAGFHPITDGLLLMENITLEGVNYFRILFEIENSKNETNLVTIWQSHFERWSLLLIKKTLVVVYNRQVGLEPQSKVIGQISGVNLLLLVIRDLRIDYFLNNKMGSAEFHDSRLIHLQRNKRSAPREGPLHPTIIIGCDETMQKCFDGLIAGTTWNNRYFLDARNTFVKDMKRFPVDNFQARTFPKEPTLLVVIERIPGQTYVITLSVVLVIFMLMFYISRRLWWRSCKMTKLYLKNRECLKNYRNSSSLIMGLDGASEIALIETKDMTRNYAVPDSSPELSSQGNYDSKLTVKSISSSILSEIEYCRILLIRQVQTVNKLTIVDYTPVPGNQIAIVVNFLPEIKIFQSLFPADPDDLLYKCLAIDLSPCRHYIYCHMVPAQLIKHEEFDLQAWKISNPYELLIKPPNISFTNSLPFTDDSYRIILLNCVKAKLSVFEMEFGTTLWSRNISNCYPMFIDPLTLLGDCNKLIVNKELSFDVIDADNGILLNTCIAPINATFRHIVCTNDNRPILLMSNIDLCYWDPCTDVYVHKELPSKVTIITLPLSRAGNRIAFGTETGEVYIPLDDNGAEYMTLGPRNDKIIMCLRFSMDGALLAAVFENNLVHVWRLEAGVPLVHFHAVHERGQVLDLSFTSDNTQLLVLIVTNKNRASSNKKILVIDVNHNVD